MREIVVDSFVGGSGSSLGISWALGHGADIAINHDREAIALHKANHPETAEPVSTIAGKAAESCAITDIGMRMLTPRELYRAHGFPGS